MPASIRILEFCTANAGRSAKWEDTRGATEGQTGLRVGAEWCLEKAPNLPPNFIGSKKGRAGMESGVKQNVPDSAGSACIIESEGLPVPLPGLGATRPEEGRGGLGSYVRSQEARSGRQKEERFPPWEFGDGWGTRTPFVSGGTCGGRTLRRVAREERKVLSSSAAEAAAAATRMDFLSHPNSTVQRCSPQSGGIPPASDAAVAAAPRARLGETNYLVGGRPEGKILLKGQRSDSFKTRILLGSIWRQTEQN